MSSNICATWRHYSQTNSNMLILPDGCRDLIMKSPSKGKPEWFISDLFDQAETVHTQEQSYTYGFRLKAGTQIKETPLLRQLQKDGITPDNLHTIINDFTHLESKVEEALCCLASDVRSVQHAASELGISTRTLQRLVHKESNRPPSYWFQLARVRKTARSLDTSNSMAELADQYGFSDQAHMCRAFKHWFRLNPSTLVNATDIKTQLNDVAFA